MPENLTGDNTVHLKFRQTLQLSFFQKLQVSAYTFG